MTYLTAEVATIALPYIRDARDAVSNEVGDLDSPEWDALFQVCLELERVMREAE